MTLMDAVSIRDGVLTCPMVISMGRCDPLRRCRLPQLWYELQEISGVHAEALGCGLTALQQYNMAWVLSRMRLELLRTPMAGETVLLSTWPGRPNRMIYPRYYVVKSQDGQMLAKGSSLWLLLDLGTRKLTTLGRTTLPTPVGPDCAPPLSEPSRLSAPVRAEGSLVRTVAASDLDINGHMNNARYVEWVFDCFPSGCYAHSELFDVQINYQHEIAADRPMRLEWAFQGGTMQLHGLAPESGIAHFTCRAFWRPVPE